MPSSSLLRWSAERSPLLDGNEHAHRPVRGTGVGARTATQQINQAYVLLLSAQFQGFCRDLHSECAAHYVNPVTDPDLRQLLLDHLLDCRKLDRGNPNPTNIGADFKRFIRSFWTVVDAHRSQNPSRKLALEELNAWRNAISHQDFRVGMFIAGRPNLVLAQVQAWRKACDGLARSFDDVLLTSIQTVTGVIPW